MRIAVLSDIHQNKENLLKIKERLIHNNIGLIFILGDITHFGKKEDAVEMLKELEFAPIIAIPGNIDTQGVVNFLEEKGISLHNKKKKISHFTAIGFGCGLEGQKGLVNSEQKIEESLGKLIEGEKNVILLTHMPPSNSPLDKSKFGTHIGSKAVRNIVEKFSPLLLLCGHCHEAAGEEKIGKTTCINIGAVFDPDVDEINALILTLNKGIKWKRIKI